MRVRAWKGMCARARGETLPLVRVAHRCSPGQVQCSRSTADFFNYICLSGELIPTESKKITGETAWQAAHLFMTRSLYAR